MYNYKLLRLGYIPICYFMFVSGICAGNIIGLIFFLLDRSSIGLFGWVFITLLIGFGSALLGLIYTAVFNRLAPALGGIPLEIAIQPDTAQFPVYLTPPDSPLTRSEHNPHSQKISE